VIPNPWWTWPAVEHYYPEARKDDRRRSPALPPELLTLAESRGGRIWVVNWSPNPAEMLVLDELEARYGPPVRHALRGLDVLLFDPSGVVGAAAVQGAGG
jgi:hypothetical protein